jgi:hypothetical protein
MQFGARMNMGNFGQEDTTRMVKQVLDRGINLISSTPPTFTAWARARLYSAMLEKRCDKKSFSPQRSGFRWTDISTTAARRV